MSDNTENAIARVETAKLAVPLDGPLNDLDQAYRLAAAFARADIVPTELRGKPSNVLLVMLYGQRLGLPPEIAISSISVVKGKPRMSGQLLLSKVREAGHKCKIVHGDGECTVTITRGDDGEQHSETFSLDDAVTARLCTIKDGKPFARSAKGEPLPWETYPKRMLQWRAVSSCVDAICSEVKMGFAVEDELDKPGPDRPTLAQVVAERTDRQEPEQPAEQDVDDQAVEAELAEIEAEIVDDPDNQLRPDDPDLFAHETEQS